MQQLADESGCSLHTIWRAETGRNKPRWETQRRIAGALGVSYGAIRAQDLPETPGELSQREEELEIAFDEEIPEADMAEVRGGFGDFEGGWGEEPEKPASSHKLSREERRKKQRASSGQVAGRKKKNRKKKGR